MIDPIGANNFCDNFQTLISRPSSVVQHLSDRALNNE
jgi:hypothetical protein